MVTAISTPVSTRAC